MSKKTLKNSEFEIICKLSQKELKKSLRKRLSKKYDEVIYADGFIFAKGTVPILLVAHMDTVHKELPTLFVYDGNKISSPQGIGGDDRCGVYMINHIIEKHHCSVLFTEDEEIGGVGVGKFVNHDCAKDLTFNYVIELDRRGNKDAVFYECENYEFEDFITEGVDWSYNYGSYSDICDIAPALGCAAVNLSCGYYNAHTKDEYVMLNEMEENIEKVCRLIERTKENDTFIYIEAKRKWGKYDSLYNYGYGYGHEDNEFKLIDHYYVIEFRNSEGKSDWADYLASSDMEAIGMWMVDYPNLCYNNIKSIEDYGEDIYTI